MNVLRHMIASFVIVAVMLSLIITSYDGFKTAYGFSETDTKVYDGSNMNIADKLKTLNFLEGVSSIQVGILKLNPPAGSSDILGGLSSVGIGAFKTITGLVSIPFEFVAIVLEFYTGIPSILTTLCMIIVVYVGFILLSLYLRTDV